MRVKVIVNDEVKVRRSDGTVIDPATTLDVEAVRDRLPAALGPNGGLKVEAIAAAEITNDEGNPVPVSGAVSVSNFPPTQAVSGPLTDLELRASAVATKPAARTYEAPVQVPVTGSTTEIAPASATARYVLVKVAPGASVGIYVNAAGPATLTNWLMGPGEVRRFYGTQAINAIRAGSADVTVYREVST